MYVDASQEAIKQHISCDVALPKLGLRVVEGDKVYSLGNVGTVTELGDD